MTLNYLSPAFIKLSYVAGSDEHTATLPVIPSGSLAPGSEPSMFNNLDNPVTMTNALNPYIALVKTLFDTNSVFLAADFWSQPLPTDDPVWIYTLPLNIIGTSAGASIPHSQIVHSYRTTAGGLYRHYLMEGAVTVNQNWTYATVPADQKALIDYMKGAAGWINGRDGGNLITFLYARTKTNDALRKRVL